MVVKNITSGESRRIDCEGIFVALGESSKSELLQGQIELDEKGYIITAANMATNIDGVFAAGDIVKKPLRQIVTAAADGATAAVSALAYINKRK